MSTPTDVTDTTIDDELEPLDPSAPPTEPRPEDEPHEHTDDCGGGCGQHVPESQQH
ncbi:hypothetical protein ACFWY9_31955 [Amycolatopsis sp. NPDC059027]|uniref:hypothetical protein n=1 Tax=unclassified Amycolatopsis TaxID=2618356 RepID=UPI00366B5FCE